MDRRDFLRLSGLVALPIAVPVLSSCSSKSKSPVADPTASAASSSSSASASGAPGSLQALVNASSGRLDVANAQAETLVGGKRVAVGLFQDNKPVTDATAMFYIGQDASRPPVATAAATWVQGEMAPRALYVAELDFPAAGEWLIGVTARGKDGAVLGGGASITVLDTSPSPQPGQPAISVPTPTQAALMGADPLCSNSPPCPMHAISLDAALKNGKPTLFTVAAPAFCQTQTCGPVIRIIAAAVPAYADRINFLHVEAYDKDDPQTLRPAATAWKLATEPFTFFIAGSGIVTDRLPGAFGADELDRRLAALAT